MRLMKPWMKWLIAIATLGLIAYGWKGGGGETGFIRSLLVWGAGYCYCQAKVAKSGLTSRAIAAAFGFPFGPLVWLYDVLTDDKGE